MFVLNEKFFFEKKMYRLHYRLILSLCSQTLFDGIVKDRRDIIFSVFMAELPQTLSTKISLRTYGIILNPKYCKLYE